MRNFHIGLAAGLLLVATSFAESAQSPAGAPVLVTADNFVRAETDATFGRVEKMGGFSKFKHYRDQGSIDRQIVQRANRDTLYSVAVFDLEAGPVTITLPDAGKRFMTLIAIDQDHYVQDVFYGAGSHIFTRDKVGTRYLLTAVRILVDPADPKDVAQVHALQDAITVGQTNQGKLEAPNWDPVSHKKVIDALVVLGATLPDLRRAFGARTEVDPVRHLIATATAWGGNPDKDAVYLNVTPASNDGTTIYRLKVRNVPVDGFWSISVYNAQGYFQRNAHDAYTLNDITAKKSTDGSVALQFGGCDAKLTNCLPITPGWNFLVRLYRPRGEILNGTWTFPDAQPVN
jgi:hypothetical protein